MRKRLPWVRFYITDLGDDERFRLLPIELKGLLLCALIEEWRSAGLPSDLASIATLLSTPRSLVKDNWARLEVFFQRHEDGRLVFPEFDEARQHAQRVSQARSEAGQTRHGKLSVAK